MKKIYSLIFAFCLLACPFQSLYAETVSLQDARRIAENFLFSANQTKSVSSQAKLVWDGSDGKSLKVPVYVFNSEDRFVVVAGDDRLSPVIGYSTSGLFDPTNIPDGLKALFDSYRRSLNPIQNKKTAPSASPASFDTGTYTVVDLNTALWGQSEPYNDSCPVWEDEHCLTGCGATALAILMRYYKYPEQPYGTLPGYTTQQHEITINPKTFDYSYRWDDMPLSNPSTDAQISAVSTLMADVGQMIKTDYDPNNTWTYSSDILSGMLEHMKYSNKAAWYDRINFSAKEWSEMLKNELDQRHPVCYRGDDIIAGGHFYIIDGYDSEGRFHFNWGWYGSSNGFFYFPDTDFSNNENALIGLVPDYSWTEPVESAELSTYYNGTGCFGLHLSDAYIENNEEFTIYADLTNYGTGSYSGEFGFYLKHADNSMKYLDGMSDGQINLGPFRYIGIQSDPLSVSDIKAGDEIVICYKKDGKLVQIKGKTSTVPLRYNIPDVLSLNYTSSGILSIGGMIGMTVSYPGNPDGARFDSPVLTIENPGTGDYTFSNGHDSYTIHLTF